VTRYMFVTSVDHEEWVAEEVRVGLDVQPAGMRVIDP